jgi:integrase
MSNWKYAEMESRSFEPNSQVSGKSKTVEIGRREYPVQRPAAGEPIVLSLPLLSAPANAARPARVSAKYKQVKKWHLRVRFDAARKAAIEACKKQGDDTLAERIKAFQFRDIRAKSASEIVDTTVASALLGHTEKDIAERVYRRVGQAVSPTG